MAAVDLLCLWWLVLGIPLSWSKGSFCPGHLPHGWLGVSFWSTSPGTATMSVPQPFVDSLRAAAQIFLDPSPRTASLVEAHNLCGKAGRLAQVACGKAFRLTAVRRPSSGLTVSPPRITRGSTKTGRETSVPLRSRMARWLAFWRSWASTTQDLHNFAADL